MEEEGFEQVEEEEPEELYWSEDEYHEEDYDDEVDIDDIMDNLDGEDPERLNQFYTFLQSVLQRDEEESEDAEKYDETGYMVLTDENLPQNILFSLDTYFKVMDNEDIIFKTDRNLETSRRSNLQFQTLDNKFYGNQSRAYKDGKIYFEVEIVHWRKKKYRNNPIIGVGLAPYSFQNGMVGWSSNSIGYHADDGGIFNNSGMHNIQGESCDTNDVMGCLWDWKKDEVLFTKNGELCKIVGSNEVIKKKRYRKYFNLVPSITTSHIDNIHYKVNLGENVIKKPFKYPNFNILSIENCWKELKNEQFIDVIFIDN